MLVIAKGIGDSEDTRVALFAFSWMDYTAAFICTMGSSLRPRLSNCFTSFRSVDKYKV